jgi:small conductance mechanosensitive channel
MASETAASGVPRLLTAPRSWSHRLGHDLSHFGRDRGLRLVLIVLGMVLAIRVVRIVLSLVENRIERNRLAYHAPRRLRALFDILNYLSAGLVAGIGAMTMLSVLGVNTGALLASAGVAGFAVGFGAQTLVKDLLSGLFLLAEGQYTIGDTVVLSGVTGVVERVTLRTTTLRGDNGDVHIVPSGEIRLVTNRSRGFARALVDVAVPPSVPMSRAIAVLEQCVAEVADDPDLGRDLLERPELLGIEAVRSDHAVVRMMVKVPPARRRSVERAIFKRVFDAFEAAGLAPPIPPPVATPTGSGAPPTLPSSAE